MARRLRSRLPGLILMPAPPGWTRPDPLSPHFPLQNGMVGGQQQTQSLKESQLVFFGLRDHLWLKGPVLGARKTTTNGLATVKK